MMHENIPARRTLDKAITLSIVEPLNFPNFFFHGNLAPSVFGFDSVCASRGPTEPGNGAKPEFRRSPSSSGYTDHITNRLGPVYYFRIKVPVNDKLTFAAFSILVVNG